MIESEFDPITEQHTERPLSILLMSQYFDYITFIGKPGALITTNYLCCGNFEFCCWGRTIYKCNDYVCDTSKTVGHYQEGFR